MAEGFFDKIYNPDVLSCLANLSNDEVFTPPEIANQMLDMLPQELFQNPDTTFLDPACKSGVFLREIAKRLIVGLESQFPDLQERVDHIFHKQIYGIAITELTSLLSRRSAYCSKYPNSEFSVSQFDNAEGNIRFRRVEHGWDKSGKCVFCGASKKQYERGEDLESHAYEWIHTMKPEEIFNMKFDVIISNPPYHLETSGAGKQAKPIYNLFVEQAKKLNSRFMTMIIPSRWFAGGMGLDAFRDNMMNDKRISKIVDYANAKDCFPENSVGGGVCYFLRTPEENELCDFTNILGENSSRMIRRLDEFPVLVRYNEAVSIIHKVQNKGEASLSEIASSLMPYGLSTNVRGWNEPHNKDDLKLYASTGVTYLPRNEISKGEDTVNKYKVLISKTGAEHAGEPGKDGKFRVITSSVKVINPGDICTHSYFVIGSFDTYDEANNLLSYLKTKFVRFMMLMAISSINLSKLVFPFVPIQDFSKSWTDEELYAKYGLSDEEIDFIESMIKPMDLSGNGDSDDKG